MFLHDENGSSHVVRQPPERRARDITVNGPPPAIDRRNDHMFAFARSTDAGPEQTAEPVERETDVEIEEVFSGDFGLGHSPEILRPLVPGEYPKLTVHHCNATLQAGENRLEKRIGGVQLVALGA